MKHQWMTTPAKRYFDQWREAKNLSTDKKAGKREQALRFTHNIPPSRIPYSRRAQQYRTAILQKHGRSVLQVLSAMLEPSRIISGYITLGTFIDKPAISALTNRDGQSLALLISPVDNQQLAKINTLKNKKKLAAQLATPNASIHDLGTIKQKIKTTIRVSIDIAVRDSLELFSNNPEINPKAFLYPVYISHGETPENIARIAQTALNHHNKQCLIPVFTSINTETQAALDLYMASLLNQGLEKTLTNFNKLTHARYGFSGRADDRLLALLKGVKTASTNKSIFSLLSLSSQRAVNVGKFEHFSNDERALLPESIKAELNLILETRKVKQIRQSIAHAYQTTTSQAIPIDILTRKIAKLAINEAILRKQNQLLRSALFDYITQTKRKKLSIEVKQAHIMCQRAKINRLIVKRQRAIGKLMHKTNELKKKRQTLATPPPNT